MATTIEEAILAINPDAEFTCSPADNTYEHIIWRFETPPIAKADIEAKQAELQTAKDAEATQKTTDKTNGNQKLLDLGLTQAEVDALTG